MPTLFTDPRSGGVKKSSGVNVLPVVADTWALVRDNSNTDVDWLIAGFDGNSKTDITVASSGSGGIDACSAALPENAACYGGVRLENGRFVTFYYAPEGCPVMQRGREMVSSIVCISLLINLTFMANILIFMYNVLLWEGVLNVLEGSDREIDMKPGLTEGAI
ncbi:hypothetical protein ACHAXR_004838 [Thalassiosira sp. AJA248-18]